MIHASCVAVGDCGVVLRAGSGQGKSSLALRLIDQGAELVGDDYCRYWVRAGALWVGPQPALAGVIEVRGIGLVTMPYRAEVRVGVVFDLCPGRALERLPTAQTTRIEGLEIPCYALDPYHNDACAKVRLAVRLATGNIKTLS